jgi:hypothetical protein
MASSLNLVDGTNYENINSLFTYSVPRSNPRGGKAVNIINKSSKQTLTLVTPVITTWGAQEGKDTDGGFTGKWSVSLQFPSPEYPNEEASKFLEFLKRFEAQVKTDALTHSLDWFGKKINSLDVIDVIFNPMLKYPKLVKGKQEIDTSRPPTLTGKLPLWENVWQLEIFDEDLNPLFVKSDNGKEGATPLTYLSGVGKAKILNAKYILQPTLWIANGKGSITWNVKQVLVKNSKVESLPIGVCMLSLSVDDKTKLEAEVAQLPVNEEVDSTDHLISATVDDSEDEGEDEEVLVKPAPIPFIEPPPVKEEAKEEVKKPKKIIKKTA